MQCPSCHFENMPQYKQCVRCGSILSGAGAETSIPFDPPRAGRVEKSLRLAVLIRLSNRIGGRITDGFNTFSQQSSSMLQATTSRISFDVSLMGMFWKGILPGLPQWYVGRTRPAAAFFGIWLLMMIGGLLTFGLGISPLFIMLALSVHLSSIIDVALRTSFERSDRIALVSIMVLTTALLIYTPTWNVFTYFASSQRVMVAIGPLQESDSLVYSYLGTGHQTQPQLGELVLYNIPNIDYSVTQGQMYRLRGNMFDRVLALEKQRVHWEDGRLFVDDKPSRYMPLGTFNKPPDVDFVVPEGHCYIVPSPAIQNVVVPTDAGIWQAMGTVPTGSIYGVAWTVRRSLFHFVRINDTVPVAETSN